MGVNYTPTFEGYTGQGKFRFWCQTVLPLVYDDSLSYMELLNKMVVYLNNTIQDVSAMETNVDSLLNAYEQLQKYVNDYFDNLDVQEEINAKLDALVEDGTMDELLEPFVTAQIPGLVANGLPGVVQTQIPGVVADQIDDVVATQLPTLATQSIPVAVESWLNENVDPVGSAVTIDKTLKISDSAADSKVVGDKFIELGVPVLVFTDGYLNSASAAIVADSTYHFATGIFIPANVEATIKATGTSNVSIVAVLGDGNILTPLIVGEGTGVHQYTLEASDNDKYIAVSGLKSEEVSVTYPDQQLLKVIGDVNQLKDDVENIENAILEPGEVISLPTDYTGNVYVDEIESPIYTGGKNLIGYIRFLNGSYTLNGVTFTVNGNEIGISGTATANTYFIPHTGTFVSDTSLLRNSTDYVIPEVSYTFGGLFTNVPGGNVSVSVRDTRENPPGGQGNVVSVQSSSWQTTTTYNKETWGQLYVYVRNGTTVTNGKIKVGILYNGNAHDFNEYNQITTINNKGNSALSVYSFSAGECVVTTPRKSRLAKSKYFKYVSGSGIDSSTEKVEVYLPVDFGYVRYDFIHTVDNDRNANVWRLGRAYATNDDLTYRYDLTVSGEWECALHLKNRSDFSGGYLHGDEVVSNIIFLADGTPIDVTDYTVATPFREFAIIENSTLYDPNDNITPIAAHGSEHIFNEYLTINQSVNWVANNDITACYLAMFPVAKTATEKAYVNSDFIVFNADGTQTVKRNATFCTLYSSAKGVNADFSIGYYPKEIDATGDYFLLTDNGGNPYNKCYYAIATNNGNASVQNGDLWKSQTFYNININK